MQCNKSNETAITFIADLSNGPLYTYCENFALHSPLNMVYLKVMLEIYVTYILWDVTVCFMSGCNSGCHAAFMRTAEYCRRALWHLSEGTELCWPIWDFERLHRKIIITNIMDQNGSLPDIVHGNSFLFDCYFLVEKQIKIAVCFTLLPS